MMEGVDQHRRSVGARFSAEEADDQTRDQAPQRREQEDGPADLQRLRPAGVGISSDDGSDPPLDARLQALGGEAGKESDGDAEEDGPSQPRVTPREARKMSEAPRRSLHELPSPAFQGHRHPYFLPGRKVASARRTPNPA